MFSHHCLNYFDVVSLFKKSVMAGLLWHLPLWPTVNQRAGFQPAKLLKTFDNTVFLCAF
jgi:hypothetical protein